MAKVLPFTFARSSWVETFVSPNGNKVSVKRNMIRVNYRYSNTLIAEMLPSECEFDLRECFRQNGLENGALTMMCTPVSVYPAVQQLVSNVVVKDAVGGVTGSQMVNKANLPLFIFRNENNLSYHYPTGYETLRAFPTKGLVRVIHGDTDDDAPRFLELTLYFFDYHIDSHSTPTHGFSLI